MCWQKGCKLTVCHGRAKHSVLMKGRVRILETVQGPLDHANKLEGIILTRKR